MNNLLKLYSELLTIYVNQIKNIESQNNELQNKQRIQYDSYAVLNRHMFIYDEYLQNTSYRGFCYSEKNLIMPYLVDFIVVFENSSEQIKTEFQKLKFKNQDQEYLDNLLKDKFPFVNFLQLQLLELKDLKYKCIRPIKPQRSNASRKIEKYEKDLKGYFEKVKILDNCLYEVNERIKLVEELKNKI